MAPIRMALLSGGLARQGVEQMRPMLAPEILGMGAGHVADDLLFSEGLFCGNDAQVAQRLAAHGELGFFHFGEGFGDLVPLGEIGLEGALEHLHRSAFKNGIQPFKTFDRLRIARSHGAVVEAHEVGDFGLGQLGHHGQKNRAAHGSQADVKTEMADVADRDQVVQAVVVVVVVQVMHLLVHGTGEATNAATSAISFQHLLAHLLKRHVGLIAFMLGLLHPPLLAFDAEHGQIAEKKAVSRTKKNE